jgi:hypothetical protein
VIFSFSLFLSFFTQSSCGSFGHKQINHSGESEMHACVLNSVICTIAGVVRTYDL